MGMINNFLALTLQLSVPIIQVLYAAPLQSAAA